MRISDWSSDVCSSDLSGAGPGPLLQPPTRRPLGRTHTMRMSDVIGTLWTIGHSTREWEVFAGMLGEVGIEVLADVRRFAGSRRNPQFSPLAMAPMLASAGIEYVAIDRKSTRLNSSP